eukprot:c26355_g1_i1 orf=203-2848(-)
MLPLQAAALTFGWAIFSIAILPCTAAPKGILVDTDVDSDDVFAILYLLKQNSSEINLKAITISSNAWSNPGHSVNHIYDILYMMGRDDILLGVGGEGGITFGGSFLPNVGGYLPLIDQGLSTVGGCRYRQSIPPGSGGILDTDTMYGLRKQFLPQGERHYEPMKQPTSQEVMLKALSSGPTIVILLGSHTNFATLLLSHPEIKQNVEHIYIMGGGVNSSNPEGCCPKGNKSCIPTECGDRGNLFDAVDSNPWAEFNIFSDPFAAYQVLHSGIPITLVPLDATNTIPVTKEFLSELEENQYTFEAQYVYRTLKIIHDTWFNDQFFQSFYMWDSFTSGVAVSGILNDHNIEKNDFAVISLKNITVVTSNKPYGIEDGSNPFFDNRAVSKFHLQKGGVHSGHVQIGLQDPFCLVLNGKGKCMDGYTMETSGTQGTRIQVAQRAKPSLDPHSNLQFSFSKTFLEKLKSRENSARYNFQTQFACYREILYKPGPQRRTSGKPVVFDMDMSPGDFIALFYLLKTPGTVIDLKAITVTSTGWANAATIDIVYDILHMMGRDDIPVGLGEFFALDQVYPSLKTIGDCKYRQSIPNGAGGLIDSDTLFGLARDLPRSPRRYTAENSVKYGAPRNTDHPELRQPKAQEVINDVLNALDKNATVTVLTGGPLTNIAMLLASFPTIKSRIKELYVTGGSINPRKNSKANKKLGNVFTVPQNSKAEFNAFLDPKAAKMVLESDLNVTLIPLDALYSGPLSAVSIKRSESIKNTPEEAFVHHLLLKIEQLQLRSPAYSHMEQLTGEVLAAAVMVNGPKIKSKLKAVPIHVMATGDIHTDGWTKVDNSHGHLIHYVETVDSHHFEAEFLEVLSAKSQTAVIASFAEQKRLWSTCNT